MRGEAASLPEGSRGLTLVEVVVTFALGVLVLGGASFVFLAQAKGYRDMGAQASVQTQVKTAVRKMITDISNTGACLSNNRYNFVMKSNELQLAYVDLKGRYCGTSDTVILKFFVVKSLKGDSLIQQHRCNNNYPTRRALISGVGDISLAFTYLDKNSIVTAAAAAVKQVEFSIIAHTAKRVSQFDKTRNPVVRVDLPN